MTVLLCSRYVLRPFADQDAPSFVEAVRESTATVGHWMSWATADYGQAQALAWFKACATSLAAGTGHEFGIFDRASGGLLGGAGLNQFNTVNKFCNLGYWVRASAQRQGAASAAVATLRDHAFQELGLCRVELVIATSNAISLGVARKAGATQECVARNRLQVRGKPTDAVMFSFVSTASA